MVNKDYWVHDKQTIKEVSDELERGFGLLNDIKQDIISFFGSAQIKETEKDYKGCEKTAFELGKRGYAIITGGGPGIMKAANTGAKKAGAISIGIRAKLIEGQGVDEPIYSKTESFEYVFLRRFVMYVKSKAWVFYPGGIGTLDELFECMQLRYTGIRNKKPIICVNKKYWEGLFKWLEQSALKNKFLMHGEKDLNLVQFADTTEEIIKIIENQVPQ